LEKQFSHKKLLFVSFTIGFIALALEILVMRSLETISGASSISTSNAIAVVLISLSLGYFLSGRVEKNKQEKLFLALTFSAILVFCAPLALYGLRVSAMDIGDDAAGFITRTFILSIIGSIIGAGVQSIFLGFSSPLVFSFLNDVVKNPQKTAAQNFIFSGIGSLFGSISPNLLLIPLMGINMSFVLLGVLATLCTAVLFFDKKIVPVSAVKGVAQKATQDMTLFFLSIAGGLIGLSLYIMKSDLESVKVYGNIIEFLIKNHFWSGVLFLGILLFSGIVGIIVVRRRKKIFLIMPTAFVCMGIITPHIAANANQLNEGVILKSETSYQTVFVKESYYNGSPLRYLSYNLSLGIQSVYDPDNKFIDKFYFDEFMIFMNKNLDNNLISKKENFDVLILGSAGGTISTYINRFYKDIYNLKITNVDIDGKVHDIAKKYFDAENENTEFVTSDGRLFVQTTDKKYDLVVVDLYSNELFIPRHVLTKEFLGEIENILKPDGIVSFNVNAASTESGIMKVLAGSIQENFQQVYFSYSDEPGDGLANFLVTGSNRKIDFNELAQKTPSNILQAEMSKIAENTAKADPVKYAGTDDKTCSECLALDLAIEING
jgi:spermidine synthase